MIVSNPLNRGPWVSERIIYVDSPKVIQKYTNWLNEEKDKLTTVRLALEKQIRDLKAEIDRKDFQISEHVKTINNPQRSPTPAAAANIHPVHERYIDNLKLAITASDSKVRALTEKLAFEVEESRKKDEVIKELRSVPPPCEPPVMNLQPMEDVGLILTKMEMRFFAVLYLVMFALGVLFSNWVIK